MQAELELSRFGLLSRSHIECLLKLHLCALVLLLWLDSDTEEEATPFYDATDLMPDENFLPSLPGSASAKHRMSPIPEPADAASDTTLVADMRHMCALCSVLCFLLAPISSLSSPLSRSALTRGHSQRRSTRP